MHSFGEISDGANPAALISVNGTLYGTTASGGTYGYGTVFSLDAAGNNFRVLHTFAGGSDGKMPMAGLVAVNGWLYGTTVQGGGAATGNGTVFAIRLRDGKERIVHAFDGSDGSFPTASLTYRNGMLYGTTSRGGSYYHGFGTVFSVNIATYQERVLHSFDNTDGAFPKGSVLVGRDGTLYGTTSTGAYNNAGTVFSLTASGTERVLHNFGYGHDGKVPDAGLIAVDGRFFGTTYFGGATGYGTVFEITSSGQETLLHSFADGYAKDGLFPSAPVLALNHKLYGTTYYGGRHRHCPTSEPCDYGTVFVLNR